MIENITISSLQYVNWTGLVTTGSASKDEVLLTDISPKFIWQAGVVEDEGPPSDYWYRFTVRENSLSSWPSNVIYYEKTGISTENYQFTFNQNRALPGGPYRNYDVVVEAVDSSGQTSAGNTLFPTLNEWGWYDLHEGWDVIHVFSNQITGLNVTGSGTNNKVFVDYNGGLNYLFSTGFIPSNVLGGYIFGSTGYFTSGQAASGQSHIVRREFTYNSGELFAYSPAVFNPFVSFVTGYTSIAFYDAFDKAHKENGMPIWTGLYLLDSFPVFTTGIILDAEVKNRIYFPNKNNYSEYLGMEMISSGTSQYAHSFHLITNSGEKIIISTKK